MAPSQGQIGPLQAKMKAMLLALAFHVLLFCIPGNFPRGLHTNGGMGARPPLNSRPSGLRYSWGPQGPPIMAEGHCFFATFLTKK